MKKSVQQKHRDHCQALQSCVHLALLLMKMVYFVAAVDYSLQNAYHGKVNMQSFYHVNMQLHSRLSSIPMKDVSMVEQT